MKVVGGPCTTAGAVETTGLACILHLMEKSRCLSSDLDNLLSRCLFLLPVVKIFGRHNFQVSAHVVVSETTQLRAYNFVLTDFRGCKMHGKIQAGHEVLMDAQRRHVKGMANVLGVHEEMNLLVYRNGQLRCDDVISGFHVMFRIETKQILGGFADHLGMNWTKLSILTWITKIKCKLPGLSLNWHGVRRGWREIHPGPSLGSERAQSQNFNAYQNNRGNDQTFGPAGENFKFSLRAG